MTFPIIVCILFLIACILWGVYRFIYCKYEAFVSDHSIAVRELRVINSIYQFKRIPNADVRHSQDNENMYRDTSPQDLLIYHLVTFQHEAIRIMNDTAENRKLQNEYLREIACKCQMDRYDTEIPFRMRNFLIWIEKKTFEEMLQKPKTELYMAVYLYLTNINGGYRDKKVTLFSETEIRGLIERLNRKRGDFYLDPEIWQAICRVERGKVTNKMRFFIYQRDGYRCKKCGRQTKDLEIDHIYPISKGGKSVADNLQTLCRRCNLLKSNHIETPLASGGTQRPQFCERCGAKLVLRTGKNGQFYGCSQFPSCKYTKRV